MNKDNMIKFLANGIPFGALMGMYYGNSNGLTAGVLSGLIGALFFGIVMTVFLKRFVNTVEKDMRSADNEFEGETIIHEGPANHFFRFEGRGGWLTLTQSRLVFRSHGKNIQNEPLEISVASIAAASETLTAKIIPNGLCVSLRDGSKEKFVVNQRAIWANKIRKSISA